MYITKKQLERELKDLTSSMNNKDNKIVKPFLILIVLLGLFITFIILIPILLLWLVLGLIYMPLSLLDSLFIKLWRHKYKNG